MSGNLLDIFTALLFHWRNTVELLALMSLSCLPLWGCLISQDEEESCQCNVWLWTGWPGFNSWQGKKVFLLAFASWLAVGPTQPLIQWVLGVCSPRVNCGHSMMLTTQLSSIKVDNEQELYLVCPQMPPWCVAGQLYSYKPGIHIFTHSEFKLQSVFGSTMSGDCDKLKPWCLIIWALALVFCISFLQSKRSCQQLHHYHCPWVSFITQHHLQVFCAQTA
jgi:hypothetical protein